MGGNKNNSGGKYGRKNAMGGLGDKAEIIFPKCQQNKEMKYWTEKRVQYGRTKIPSNTCPEREKGGGGEQQQNN